MASGDPSGPAPSGYMRQRSRCACAPCRQRKRKCDGTFPCSTCTGYGYECVYTGANGQPESNNTSIVQTSTSATASTAATAGTKRKAGSDEIASSPATSHKSRHTPGSHSHGDEIAVNKDSAPLLNGVILPSGRYMSQHSSVAFPQWVGKNLQSISPPRVHSFAYNAGIRKEMPYSVTFELQKYVTWVEVHDALDIYASVINPVFGFIDIEDLHQRSHDHWHGKNQGSNFEALISGVIGLASLFSKLLCEGRESRVVQHAKDILDDPYTLRVPRLDTISACVLRTIYIRSTTRPGPAWLHSCTTMHLCEAIGVYRQLESPPDKVTPSFSLNRSKDIPARVAMVARCLHIIISYEHGRSMVEMGPISEHNIVKRSGDLSLQLNALVNTLPLEDNRGQDLPIRKQELSIALSNLIATPTDHEFFSLVKVDLCFCIYRRLRLLDLGISQEQLTQIIQAGKAALPAARVLILRNHPWWNTIGTVFQYICVLLAIDSSESLAIIPEAMETLETIAKHLKTHLADEAMNTAKLLVRSMTEKKKKEAAILEKTTGKGDQIATTSSSFSTNNTDAQKPIATNGGNDNNDNNDNDGGTPLIHAANTTDPTNVVGDTNAGQGNSHGPVPPPQEWTNGLLDFMDPLWNWDAFFEPPLVSSHMVPFPYPNYQ